MTVLETSHPGTIVPIVFVVLGHCLLAATLQFFIYTASHTKRDADSCGDKVIAEVATAVSWSRFDHKWQTGAKMETGKTVDMISDLTLRHAYEKTPVPFLATFSRIAFKTSSMNFS